MTSFGSQRFNTDQGKSRGGYDPRKSRGLGAGDKRIRVPPGSSNTAGRMRQGMPNYKAVVKSEESIKKPTDKYPICHGHGCPYYRPTKSIIIIRHPSPSYCKREIVHVMPEEGEIPDCLRTRD